MVLHLIIEWGYNMYHLSNGLYYEVKFEKNRIFVREYADRFKGMFISTTGNDVSFDNYSEVREYLKEMNGGVEI